ncbi:hypothetical protein BDQ17DRAFT_1414502 [Cyathus striatus]|nr:hypothetical protein BDQ17DRAFT_1414502 [Cyathus striatus]
MSTATRPFFTYSQIVRFGLLVQRIQGAKLVTHDNEVVPLPNDARLVRAIDNVSNLAVSESDSPLVKITSGGIHIQIMRRPEAKGSSSVFSVAATTSKEELLHKSPSSGVKEYHVFDDYATSFIWPVTDSGRDHLDDPKTEFDRSLADRLIAWAEAYDDSFRRRGLDQGADEEVFDTIEKITSWTMEGALLSVGIALTTSTPVVYSAYLRKANAVRFSGDEDTDGEIFCKLVLKLKEQLSLSHDKSPAYHIGILRLIGSGQ